MNKIFQTTLICFVILFTSCKKDKAPSIPTVNNCSTPGLVEDTIINNGTTYYIVANFYNNSNDLVVELVNKNGAYSPSLSLDFVNVRSGNNCYENTVAWELYGQYKAYVYSNSPSWISDTNSVCMVKITMDSTVYYLRDKRINQ